MNAQDIIIRQASKNGTLHIKEFLHKFTYPGWNICDSQGTIEVALSEADALGILRKNSISSVNIFSGATDEFRTVLTTEDIS